jgi:hypothetical protein
MPTISEMLSKLEKLGIEGKAPLLAILELKDFKESQWGSLTSMVHSGIHAINRHKLGYPCGLIVGVLKCSNGLLFMTAMMIANISDDDRYRTKLKKYQQAFMDCLPPESEAKGRSPI